MQSSHTFQLTRATCSLVTSSHVGFWFLEYLVLFDGAEQVILLELF